MGLKDPTGGGIEALFAPGPKKEDLANVDVVEANDEKDSESSDRDRV
mgnify:CR=1 FL=1